AGATPGRCLRYGSAHLTPVERQGTSDQLGFFDVPRRRDLRRAVRRFGVFEDLSFVVADNDAIGVVAENVFGADRHFAAAAGSVDDVGGDGVAAGVSAELFHDVESFSHAGAEVSGPGDQVALVDVIGFD